MSKIGSYLQEHISGEVVLANQFREALSRDGSILKVTPEMAIYPKVTNDIRKVARFSWQLAERGHVLPITPRGAGTDQAGGAIGGGIVLALSAYMNTIFEYEPKRRLVRLQPGVTVKALSGALGLSGMDIPALRSSPAFSTVGGAVACNASSVVSGKYGPMSEWVDQIEVVLANGDVIQTGRISKREVNRKKGLQTFEGEIYRSIDNLIDDNAEIMPELAERASRTNAGYCQIASVKKKDGSIDLTPLFVGSEGTLGVIVEMILKTDYIARQQGVVVAVFDSADAARDSVDQLVRLDPAFLEYFDGAMLRTLSGHGKKFAFLEEAEFDARAVLVIGFDDPNERTRSKHIKKVRKLLGSEGVWLKSADGEGALELLSIRDALQGLTLPGEVDEELLPILGGAYVPPEQVSIFTAGLEVLSKKYNTPLPVYGRELTSTYYVYPALNLKKVGDKQKVFKLLDDYAKLIEKVNGELISEDSEGRLRSRFALGGFDEATTKMFADLKAIFDPYGMLNPGVKQGAEIKQLAPMIQSGTVAPGLPNYIP